MAKMPSDLVKDFDIETTVTLLASGDYKRIGLQFPDELVPFATNVVRALSARLPQVTCILLTDTSHSNCCVDTVALKHTTLDILLHYGKSCLSPVNIDIPLYYVFERYDLDLDQFASQFSSELSRDERILFFYDTGYHYALPAIQSKLEALGYGKSIVWSTLSKLVDPSKPEPSLIDDERRTVHGRTYTILPSTTLSDYTLFYLGPSSLALTNLMLTHSACHQAVSYDPSTSSFANQKESVDRMLQKRYFLVQKAKAANVIGIVIGTTGVESSMTVVNSLMKRIKLKGKKPYLITVGKPSPAKLGNFLEIDIFVLVACPESSLLDSREFMTPVVTPFEMTIALDGVYDWNPSGFKLDLSDVGSALQERILKEEQRAAEKEKSSKASSWQDQESDEEPDFSLVTGQYASKSFQNLAGDNHRATSENDDSASTSLISTSSEKALTRNLMNGSAAALYLNEKRTFKGLEVALGKTAISEVEQGRSGIASGYTHEPSKQDQ